MSISGYVGSVSQLVFVVGVQLWAVSLLVMSGNAIRKAYKLPVGGIDPRDMALLGSSIALIGRFGMYLCG